MEPAAKETTTTNKAATLGDATVMDNTNKDDALGVAIVEENALRDATVDDNVDKDTEQGTLLSGTQPFSGSSSCVYLDNTKKENEVTQLSSFIYLWCHDLKSNSQHLVFFTSSSAAQGELFYSFECTRALSKFQTGL